MRSAPFREMSRVKTIVFNPRVQRVGSLLLTLLLVACQENGGGGGGGAPAY